MVVHMWSNHIIILFVTIYSKYTENYPPPKKKNRKSMQNLWHYQYSLNTKCNFRVFKFLLTCYILIKNCINCSEILSVLETGCRYMYENRCQWNNCIYVSFRSVVFFHSFIPATIFAQINEFIVDTFHNKLSNLNIVLNLLSH